MTPKTFQPACPSRIRRSSDCKSVTCSCVSFLGHRKHGISAWFDWSIDPSDIHASQAILIWFHWFPSLLAWIFMSLELHLVLLSGGERRKNPMRRWNAEERRPCYTNINSINKRIQIKSNRKENTGCCELTNNVQQPGMLKPSNQGALLLLHTAVAYCRLQKCTGQKRQTGVIF